MSFLRSGRLCYAILYCFVWFYYLCVLLMEFYPFNAVLCFCRNTLVAMVTKVVLFYIREDFIFCMFCIINSAGQRRSRLLVPLGIRRLFVCKLFSLFIFSEITEPFERIFCWVMWTIAITLVLSSVFHPSTLLAFHILIISETNLNQTL